MIWLIISGWTTCIRLSRLLFFTNQENVCLPSFELSPPPPLFFLVWCCSCFFDDDDVDDDDDGDGDDYDDDDGDDGEGDDGDDGEGDDDDDDDDQLTSSFNAIAYTRMCVAHVL